MINKKHNLSLKLNKSLNNVVPYGPFTPLDQTLKTPVDSHQPNYFQPNLKQGTVYGNPSYNESDDILTDIDEPSLGSSKVTKNYTINFTNYFDSLVMSIYSHILSLPTTTPFSGVIPPSGLVSRVANETMDNLISYTSSSNHPPYDQQSIITIDYLKNHSYQPIFLQLIRKRLIDLCTFHSEKVESNGNKLPMATTVFVTSNNGGTIHNANAPYSNNVRQSSISNLSLTDLNLSNYNSNNSNNSVRSRSSSVNLRKQSLTRNNSCNGSNWLHVGNMNNFRPQNNYNQPMQNDSMNISNDSLQSMQDYVSQPLISRSAGNTPSTSNSSSSSNNTGFNPMMMGYQTPPNSNKNSVSSSASMSSNGTNNQNIQIVQNNHGSANSNELDYFNFANSRSRSSSRNGGMFPGPLTINTENANYQALNSLNGNDGETLDSPFMSATTPSEEYGYFSNSTGVPTTPVESNRDSDSTSNSSMSSTNGKKEPINLPSQFGLSEKKRDSLKLKRGIH